MPEKRQLIPGSIRAAIDSTSYNEKENTVDVIAATDAPVLRMGWDGPFYEILDMSSGSIRSERINAGAPVLDNHGKYGSVREMVLGIVVPGSVKFAAGKMTATVRLSQRADLKDFVQEVKDGIQRNLSIGYNVFELTETIKVGQIDTYRATDWEPFELSWVTVPGDFTAGTRAENTTKSDVSIIKKVHTMTPEEKAALAAERKRSAEILKACTAAKLTSEYATELISSDRSLEECLLDINSKRSAIETPAPATAPATPAADERSAVKIERERTAGILTAVRAAGLSTEFAETLIGDEKITLDIARHRVIDEMAAKQTPAQRSAHIAVTDDEGTHKRNALEYALCNRGAAEVFPLNKKDDKVATMATEFRGISLIDAAKYLLGQRGIEIGYSKVETVDRSLASGDFPNLLSNLAGKFLRREYELAPQTWKQFARQQDLPDFKPATGIQFGAASEFDKVEEEGEYKYGSFSETADSWKLSTYGKMFKMSRVMIINDDLGGFTRTASLIAARAANNEANIVWALLVGGSGGNGATLGDTIQLFNASHNNLAGSGGLLSVATLSAARTAMARQTGLNSKELINVKPRFLVVPPEQQTLAEQLVTNITPALSTSVNPFTGKLEVIVDQHITSSTAWHLIADMSTLDGITYGYLQGAPGLFTETRYGFNVDGVELKARTDFAAKVWDYRGFYKNPGA